MKTIIKTRREQQIDLIHQIVALFPKDWNPQDEEDEESQEMMMMLKIGAELARARKIQDNFRETINNNITNLDLSFKKKYH